MWNTHKTVVKESGSRGSGSGLESSVKPGELDMNTNK